MLYDKRKKDYSNTITMVTLTFSQVPTTCLYLEVNDSSPHIMPYYFEIHFNIILPSVSRFCMWSLHGRLSNQNFNRMLLLNSCHGKITIMSVLKEVSFFSI